MLLDRDEAHTETPIVKVRLHLVYFEMHIGLILLIIDRRLRIGKVSRRSHTRELSRR